MLLRPKVYLAFTSRECVITGPVLLVRQPADKPDLFQLIKARVTRKIGRRINVSPRTQLEKTFVKMSSTKNVEPIPDTPDINFATVCTCTEQ